MRVDQIKLENYRNIEMLELSPTAGVNIIYGENAQGKTNLIEAVWMFTGAKSFRGGKDKEMIRFGMERCFSQVDFFCGGRQQEASIEIQNGDAAQAGKKNILLNGIPAETAAQLTGKFYAVVFSPAHLSLVRDGPVERRRFLDTAICQIVPRYEGYLKEYNRILMQRNALMKDLSRFPQLLDTVDIWDDHLAKVAAAISVCRARYVRKLAPIGAEVYAGISRGREQFQIQYRGSGLEELPELADSTREQVKQVIYQKLTAARKTDMERGLTSIGPHRDDLEFTVNQTPMRLYGSQGQQRSGVLALKMAECSMIEESVGETPVVLLDDVMSELDAGRRDYLLNQMDGKQVFVTCCDDQSFRSMKNGRSFLMAGGALIQDNQAAETAADREGTE